MTDPANPPPVFLPEPQSPRAEAPPPPPPANRRQVHPDWDSVLAPGESVLWDGKPETASALQGRNRKSLIILIMAGAFVAAIFGDTPVPVFFGIAAFFLLQRQSRRAQEVEARTYLLTDRAAYIAKVSGARLMDVQSFPITPTLRLGLGTRSVAFATRFNKEGREVAEGFLDIPDAARVHDLIRDIQKAKA